MIALLIVIWWLFGICGGLLVLPIDDCYPYRRQPITWGDFWASFFMGFGGLIWLFIYGIIRLGKITLTDRNMFRR